MGQKFGVLPGLDDNLPMPGRSGSWNQNICQGMVICHSPGLYVMLTTTYKGLGLQLERCCRVPGVWDESVWDSCVSLTSNFVQPGKVSAPEKNIEIRIKNEN